MSKKAKLLAKFCKVPPPKDFRWEEMVLVMNHLGFDLDMSGGSSHGHFVLRSDPNRVIDIYRPHPSGIMYAKQLTATIEKLKEWGVLP
ncbi:MAG: hypothetical protein AB1409_08355 [Pseudomonadota bacterium]